MRGSRRTGETPYRAHSWRNMAQLYERPGDLARFLAEETAALETFVSEPIGLRVMK